MALAAITWTIPSSHLFSWPFADDPHDQWLKLAKLERAKTLKVDRGPASLE